MAPEPVSPFWIDDTHEEVALPLGRYVLEANVINQSFRVNSCPSERLKLCELMKSLFIKFRQSYLIDEELLSSSLDLADKLYPPEKIGDLKWWLKIDEPSLVEIAKTLRPMSSQAEELRSFCDENAVEFLLAMDAMKVLAKVQACHWVLDQLSCDDPVYSLVGQSEHFTSKLEFAAGICTWTSSRIAGSLHTYLRTTAHEKRDPNEIPLMQAAFREMVNGRLAGAVDAITKVPAHVRAASVITERLEKDKRLVSKSQDWWAVSLKCSKKTVNRAMKTVSQSTAYRTAIGVSSDTAE